MTFPFKKYVGVCFSYSDHCFLTSYCIYRYADCSAWFVHAYGEGLTGPQAAWANKKYHGHRTLPPDMIREIKDSILP